MKASTRKMTAVLALSAIAWTAGNASAFGGGVKVRFGGGHGRGHISFGHRGHHHHGHHHGHHHRHHHHVHVKKYYVKPVYVAPVAPCIHPLHSFCFVYPGDTWTLLSLREYGQPNFGATIAAFNGMSTTVRLVVGQQLRLPVIHPNGSLTPSSAPAPAPFVLPSQPVVGTPLPIQGFSSAPQSQPFSQGQPISLQGPIANQGMPGQPMPSQGMQLNANGGPIGPQGPFNGPMNGPAGTPNAAPSAPVVPAANVRVATAEPSRPSVASGSMLMLDGQSLGGEAGSVRLRAGGLALPAEVIEWSESSVKIRLPELDLEGPMKADMEVLRADGSLASKTAIELTSAATRLALGN